MNPIARRDWRQRLGSRVHAEAIIDRIVHNNIWVETGGHNMSEHTAGQGMSICVPERHQYCG